MNVLLVYPKYPDTYWSFKHVLKFISKKAAVPPLGIITVSALLPSSWNKKLVDLNVDNLTDEDLKWADYLLISGMYVQKASVRQILDRCQKFSLKTIAGGPLFTQDYMDYPEIDHFILNEAEITLPDFLCDLEAGKARKIYQTDKFADMSLSPVPDYHLLKLHAYVNVNVQVSRGCPFACDFCEITTLLGHTVRMKNKEQVLNELNTLYNLHWRGPVSVVDDNFIGNKKIIKKEILPAMQNWMEAHKYPFNFNAQTSINLADDPELLTMMRKVGFISTFIGIETPDEESLQCCQKVQNSNRNLLESVRRIQQEGIQVSAGFIVGFDSDSGSVFQRQIDFIQKSGIVTAMVGLLNAPKNTRLYKQMENENRLLVDATGSNTDYTMNFIPKMDRNELYRGYRYIIESIYQVKPYYRRIKNLLLNYTPSKTGKARFDLTRIGAFFRSILVLGIFHNGRNEYWKFIIWTAFRKPGSFSEAITLAVYGHHFRLVYGLDNNTNFWLTNSDADNPSG